MAVRSGGLKHKLWRAAMRVTPIPTLARPRDAEFWQRRWRERLPEAELQGYAEHSDLKTWLAKQIVALAPASVLELGCNVGNVLREIRALDSQIALNGIELNGEAIAFGRQNVLPPDATIVQGSMADATRLIQQPIDVVFSSTAIMHVNDELFGQAKAAALTIAQKAIVHLEYHAWTPADLYNGREWRSSFLSDRWIRDYVAEYEGDPRVAAIEARAIPLSVNFMDNIGRLKVSDATGLVIVHLRAKTPS
jgi:SAM-dependent methyltransferase